MAIQFMVRTLFKIQPGSRVAAAPPGRRPREHPEPTFCLKAKSTVRDVAGTTVGEFIGYDTDYSIVQRTGTACKRHIRVPGNAKRTCSPVELTFVPHNQLQCNGQIFLMWDDQVKRIV